MQWGCSVPSTFRTDLYFRIFAAGPSGLRCSSPFICDSPHLSPSRSFQILNPSVTGNPSLSKNNHTRFPCSSCDNNNNYNTLVKRTPRPPIPPHSSLGSSPGRFPPLLYLNSKDSTVVT